MIKRVLICGAVAAMLAPETGRAFAPSYQCVFKTSCSADAGGCEATKVSYGLARADETWTVFDAYNQSEIDEVRVETMEDAVSLRWRAGGVWRNELALTEIVLMANGQAAMSSIGANDGALGASVLTGRCEEASGGSDR